MGSELLPGGGNNATNHQQASLPRRISKVDYWQNALAPCLSEALPASYPQIISSPKSLDTHNMAPKALLAYLRFFCRL